MGNGGEGEQEQVLSIFESHHCLCDRQQRHHPLGVQEKRTVTFPSLTGLSVEGKIIVYQQLGLEICLSLNSNSAIKSSACWGDMT